MIESPFNISEEELLNLIKNAQWHHYGLPVVEIEGEEWAIALTDEEADKAAEEYVENTAWAFTADYLQDMTGIPHEMFEAVQDKCEGAQDAILACIEATCGIESFRENAVADNGRGTFLSGYDGQEEEFEMSDGNISYAYRLN